MRFTFQNVRGLGDEQDGANAKLDELLHHIHNYGVDVAMIVESCRSQAEDLIVQAPTHEIIDSSSSRTRINEGEGEGDGDGDGDGVGDGVGVGDGL